MNNAIELEGVGYRTGSFELRDVSLSVPAGSVYGFLGPNGSGKTTTMRLLMGMARPLRGTIRLLGEPVPGGMPSILARTGYVPEQSHLYGRLTVGDAIRHHAAFFPDWSQAMADGLARQFRLRPEQRVERLSKGETGQLLLLLALGQRPELLLLDEPTDALDPVVRREMLTALLEYVAETGATIFISSHLVHELERFCDWVALLDDGRVTAELPMQEFKDGIKRLRVLDPPAETAEAPFAVLAREPATAASGETWTVRGWEDSMRPWFQAAGATLKDVADLDLEETFVELLSATRRDGEEA